MEETTIKWLSQFLLFVKCEYEKYNSLVVKGGFTVYLTAKFDTKQEGQVTMSSNLFCLNVVSFY